MTKFKVIFKFKGRHYRTYVIESQDEKTVLHWANIQKIFFREHNVSFEITDLRIHKEFKKRFEVKN